jgi:DNA polymerase I-like protein with 3'-5' exonuclease and polymerase domains
VDAVKATAKERKFLYGIDKRKLPVRSSHAALNVVLQSAGALLVKFATVIWHGKIAEAGYVWGKDWAQVAHVHDEVQAIARTTEIGDHLGRLFVESLELAGRHFHFRCPTTGEYKIGKNWKETH